MPTLNPWLIIGAILTVLGLCSASYIEGRSNGINAQKVADQAAIDKINAKIAENKRIANAELINATNGVIAMQQDNDKLKNRLQQEKIDHAQVNDRLANELYVSGLRFRADNQRSGAGGDNALPETDATGNAETFGCKLSQKAASSLIGLAKDCDSLSDDYRVLYGWAHEVK